MRAFRSRTIMITFLEGAVNKSSLLTQIIHEKRNSINKTELAYKVDQSAINS